jgi:hypothetical protein
MGTKFEEGETYTNPKTDKDIMVLGIGRQTADGVTLAVLYVDRESYETTSNGEITIKNSEANQWTLVQHEE